MTAASCTQFTEPITVIHNADAESPTDSHYMIICQCLFAYLLFVHQNCLHYSLTLYLPLQMQIMLARGSTLEL